MIQLNATNFITVGLMAVFFWVAAHWLLGLLGISDRIPGVEVD